MMRGEPVTVLRKSVNGTDEMGEPVVAWEPEVVKNVLWGPSESDRIADPTRPDGTDDTLTLHFPKTYTASLAGCLVEIAGMKWSVVGDPQGYMPSMTPGSWNRPVVARKVEG